MGKSIVLFVESEERLKFFKRFVSVIKKDGYKPIFLTDHYSMIVNNRCENIKYIRRMNSNYISKQIYFYDMLDNIYEYRLQSASIEDIKSQFYACYETLSDINKKCSIEYIFLWNGMSAIGRSAKKFASDNNIGIRFFELANIPGKTFVDTVGVNRESNLFKNPQGILSKTKLNNEKYSKWKESYLKLKSSSYSIPQARKKTPSFVRRMKNFLYDLYGYKYKNGTFVHERIALSQIYSKLSRGINTREKSNSYQSFGFDCNYVFFPMQCKNDTQLLFNSRVDNAKAIEIASQYAVMNKCALVIKPHPAELEKIYIEELTEKLREKNIDYYITNENTMKLIINSKRVFTINSTVGLEALIANVPVTFLGYSMYEKFDQEIVKRYISDYLLDIELFNDVELSKMDFYKIRNCL